MSWLTPGRRSASLTLDGEEVPSLTLESAVTAAGRTVLLTDQNSLPLHRRVGPQVPGQVIQTEAVTEVSISSMGFAADGEYHIRFRQDPDISPAYASEYAGQPLFNVRYYLHDPEEPDHWPSQEMDDVEYTQVEDGWDFCLPSLTPDTLAGRGSHRERQRGEQQAPPVWQYAAPRPPQGRSAPTSPQPGPRPLSNWRSGR